MSWEDAKIAARERAEKIIAGFDSQRGRAVPEIPLMIFPTAGDYEAIRSPEEKAHWSWKFHTMVMRALARELRARGIKSIWVQLRAADYIAFCIREKLEPGEEARVKFFAERTKIELSTK